MDASPRLPTSEIISVQTMTTTCPHCQAEIEIDASTHAALAGQSHFACPACQSAVPVPAPVKLQMGAVPGAPSRQPAGSPPKALGGQNPATRHTNRNLLILGTAALLVLGGIGIFLASQKSGDTHNTSQKIRNEIINNSYFKNLIAAGVTTREDLDAISVIRPFEGGFIGISMATMEWEPAKKLAERTGANILAAERVSVPNGEELISWLSRSFPNETAGSLWISKNSAPAVLTGSEVFSVNETKGSRKVVLRWDGVVAGGQTTSDLGKATMRSPYQNSLGMRFVPVPVTGGPTGGRRVLFSIWETRVNDYAAYAAENPGAGTAWKNVVIHGHQQRGDHPVIHVNQLDAMAFCEWLTKKEGIKYRLPTDHEWSCAVGIGEMEDANEAPAEKSGRLANIFPWGNDWPPPPGAGNYYGEEGTTGWTKIPRYRDQHPITSPVGSYAANRFGLFDLGGNVWEMTSSRSAPSSQAFVARGAAWSGFDPNKLNSSLRNSRGDDKPAQIVGFRVVAE
jgi:formylglycine-generating enzyme required for sulfatase activity